MSAKKREARAGAAERRSPKEEAAKNESIRNLKKQIGWVIIFSVQKKGH